MITSKGGNKKGGTLKLANRRHEEDEILLPEIEEIEIEKLRGTELSETAEEYWDAQKRRVAFQLKIIAGAKLVFKSTILEEYGQEVAKAVEQFDMALAKRQSFTDAFTLAREKLLEIGKWEECSPYFQLHEMVKKRRPMIGKRTPGIIEVIKPPLSLLERWSDWREQMYKHHLGREEMMLKILKESIGERPVWKNWMSQVKGIGFALAAQVIGGFETALRPEETLAEHFKKASQMWAFAGLDVDPETGKARRKVKGQKLTFNEQLRAALLGRLGTSFLRQLDGGYRMLYLAAKSKLQARFNRERIKIVPSSKLPEKDGKKYEPPGKISEGHVHAMARRKMIKIFVYHFWEELRKAAGLPAGKPYVIEVLGHPESSYIAPIRDKAAV